MTITIPTTKTTAGELPVFVFGADEELTIAESIEVGDIVAVGSRGRLRAAKVTKVGPKRVQVAYTTKGAIDEAVKIAGISEVARVKASRVYELKNAKQYRETADGIDAGTIAATDRDHGPIFPFGGCTIEEREAIIAKWKAEQPAQLREWAAAAEARWTDEETACKVEEAAAKDAVPFAEKVVNATHVTTKSVSRGEVFAVAAGAGEEGC